MATSSHRWTLSPAERATFLKFASLALPRHTSYPTPQHWLVDDPGALHRREWERLAASDDPVSLYLHIPFCERLCRYCACSRLVVGRSEESADMVQHYLTRLKQEISESLGAAGRTWRVAQLHLGGGTPTYLSPRDLADVLGRVMEYVTPVAHHEFSAEIDPRATSREHLAVLKSFGFNRLSLGVQDFNATVQQAINRIQPYDMVKEFVETCRELGFSSINFDLIYGLPRQTFATIMTTVEQVMELSPDRIAFYRLALIPDVYKWQKTFRDNEVPQSPELLDAFLEASQAFTQGGYEFIGLDHYARPREGLAEARRAGTLRRNFQGMTTGAELPILAFGPSAISTFPRAYTQRPSDYYKWQKSPWQTITKGVALTDDDVIRRAVIEDLYCYHDVSKARLNARFGVNFDRYFASALPALQELAELGLLSLNADGVKVKEPLGILLLRVIASVFDAYLPQGAFKTGLAPTAASRVG